MTSIRFARLAVRAMSAALLLAPASAFAASFYVNDPVLWGDANPGDGICEATSGLGNCNALAAVGESNALAGTDTIVLPAGEYESYSFNGIADTTVVVGAGAADTTIVGPGNDTTLHFDLNVDLTLIGLTVTGGNGANVGGGIRIDDDSRLTLVDCVIRDNRTTNVGGGLYINSGHLTMSGTTVTGNTAGNVGGGVHINENATADIFNSTISGNRAGNTGGGLSNQGRTDLNASTIVNNSCGNVGAGVNNDFEGAPSLRIANSLIAGNYRQFHFGAPVAEDCRGDIVSIGHNLIQMVTIDCRIDWADPANEFYGFDPEIGPLADNGGPTPTHAIAPSSTAVNNGNPDVPTNRGGSCPPTDQRGIDRPGGIACDIGAFELSRCGNGTVDAEEECDDGGLLDGDGCDSNCTVTRCGNGVTTEGEECDDANALDGDCCSSGCMLPPLPEGSIEATDVAFSMRRGGKMALKWRSDTVAARTIFGDPTEDTDVSLCVIDMAGAEPTLVAGIRVSAGAGWKSTATAYDYRSSSTAAGTISKLRLGGGSSLKIRARGISPKLRSGRLPLIAPISVIVRTTNETAFSASFDGSGGSIDDFRGRSR